MTSFLLVAVAIEAHADEPCQTAASLHAAMDAIDADVRRVRIESARTRLDQFSHPCFAAIVPPSDVARLAQQLSLVAWFEQNEVEAVRWGLAARTALPAWPWPPEVGADHPLLEMIGRAGSPDAVGPPDKGLVFPRGGAVFLDGRVLTAPRAFVETPALLQVADANGRVVRSWWQDGAAFPADVLGPPGATPEPPKWFVPEDTAGAIAGVVAARKALPVCQPFSADAMQELVARARNALTEDDVFGYGAVYRALQRDLPCIDGPVPADVWADFLVTQAIVEYAVGQAWQEPLSTALTVRPDADRELAPEDIRTFVAPPPPPSGPALPADAHFWLDGIEVKSERDLAGVHVLQREKNGTWTTRLVRNTTFPADFRAPVVAAPAAPAQVGPVRGSLLVLAGFGSSGQSLDQPGNFLSSHADRGPAFTLASRGEVRPEVPILGAWQVGAPILVGGPPAIDAFAEAGVPLGPAAIVLGGGVTTVTVSEGPDQRTVAVPQPRLGVLGRAGLGSLALDAGLLGGGTPAAVHTLAFAEVRPAHGTTWVVGLDFGWTRALFEEVGADRTVAATRWQAGIGAGLAFGG